MSECIICYVKDKPDIVWSICNHGPYCYDCYSIITSHISPKCSICRRELAQTFDPNLIISIDGNIRFILSEIIYSTQDQNNQINNSSYPPNQKKIYNEARKQRRINGNNHENTLVPAQLNFEFE